MSTTSWQRVVSKTHVLPYATHYMLRTEHLYQVIYKKSIDAKHQRASKQEMQKAKMN
jgi:hypothetical protein